MAGFVILLLFSLSELNLDYWFLLRAPDGVVVVWDSLADEIVVLSPPV